MTSEADCESRRVSTSCLTTSRSIIPPLKKISKTATQLEKMRQWTMKLAKLDMKGSLKPVKKDISRELKEEVSDTWH